MTLNPDTDATTGSNPGSNGVMGIVRHAKPILFVVLVCCVAGVYWR